MLCISALTKLRVMVMRPTRLQFLVMTLWRSWILMRIVAMMIIMGLVASSSMDGNGAPKASNGGGKRKKKGRKTMKARSLMSLM